MTMDASDIHSVFAQWIMHVVEEQRSISDADCPPSQLIQLISFCFLFLTYSDLIDYTIKSSCLFHLIWILWLHLAPVCESIPGFVTRMQSNEEGPAGVHVICSGDSWIVAYSRVPDEIPAFLTWWKNANTASQLENSSTIFCWDFKNCKSDVWQHSWSCWISQWCIKDIMSTLQVYLYTLIV